MTAVNVSATATIRHELNGSYYVLRLEAGAENMRLYDELSSHGDLVLFEKSPLDINAVAAAMMGSDPDKASQRLTSLNDLLMSDQEIPDRIAIKDLLSRMHRLTTRRPLTHAAHRAIARLAAARLSKLAEAIAECLPEASGEISLG